MLSYVEWTARISGPVKSSWWLMEFQAREAAIYVSVWMGPESSTAVAVHFAVPVGYVLSHSNKTWWKCWQLRCIDPGYGLMGVAGATLTAGSLDDIWSPGRVDIPPLPLPHLQLCLWSSVVFNKQRKKCHFSSGGEGIHNFITFWLAAMLPLVFFDKSQSCFADYWNACYSEHMCCHVM